MNILEEYRPALPNGHNSDLSSSLAGTWEAVSDAKEYEIPGGHKILSGDGVTSKTGAGDKGEAESDEGPV